MTPEKELKLQCVKIASSLLDNSSALIGKSNNDNEVGDLILLANEIYNFVNKE